MKIRSITLERFRQFEKTVFEVNDFNVLVGPNNSGKTSLLHAIRAFFLLMSGHVIVSGNPPTPDYHRRFLSSAEEIAPTPDIRELWFRQQTGKPINISLTFEDETTFGLVLRLQFGQLHVSTSKLPTGLSSEQIGSYLDTPVAFIPGLVGVLVTEPYATTARRNSLASQGRYSEIFRSSLEQLSKRNPEFVEAINKHLKELFGVSLDTVSFDHESDEYVTVRYSQNGSEYDVVSSGSGLQQVIQILTYLYLSKPRILLIDEPDAHLHSRLQSSLGGLFRRVADDLDAQVFLSTHSLDLIDTFGTNDVIVVDSTKETIRPLGQNVDLVSTLVDANIVDVSALSRLLSSRSIVVVEDKDQTVLKAIDKAIGSPLYSTSSDAYVMPAKGVGNFRAIGQLGHVLQQIIGREFDVSFIQDRDGLPDFLEQPFLDAQTSDDIRPVLLQRHEIESFLVVPELIKHAASESGSTIQTRSINKAIVDAATDLKANARRMCRETAKGVNRHLPSETKVKEADLEEQVDEWFDKLDLSDIETVVKVFPGKELLASVLKKLNHAHSTDLTRGILVAHLSEEFVPADIRQTIRDLAKMKS